MIKTKGIINNAVEETTNYLTGILPNIDYEVKAGKQISQGLIDIDVYTKNNNTSNINTLRMELRQLEIDSLAFKYTIHVTTEPPRFSQRRLV